MAKPEDSRPPPAAKDVVEPMLAMAKRRGFIAPAYELYGGTAGFYDYGPLGAALKLNFEDLWRRHYVLGEGFAEIQCPTIAPEPVFRASGHLAGFSDPLIECRACRSPFRADHVLSEHVDYLAVVGADEMEVTPVGGKGAKVAVSLKGLSNLERVDRTLAQATVPCPSCKAIDAWDKARTFNLMFRTSIGPGSHAPAGYLRPETAQGMFVNFPWLYRYFREALPFGAVQIGKAYRNEIAPRQALIRLREFHQAEVEYFCEPGKKGHPGFAAMADVRLPLVPNAGEPGTWRLGEAVARKVIANEAVAFFIGKTFQILVEAGLKPDRIRFRQHLKDEMAHYASDCWDAEYHSARFGWVECVGIADRGSYDLESHARVAGTPLVAFRRYDTPREVDITRVAADMKKLGPLFKGDAKAVADACAALAPAAIPASGTVKVRVGDGDVEVPVAALTVQRVRERIDGEPYVPHVVEPSYGVDRILFAVLEHSYEDAGEWPVLRLPAALAPIVCGVFPLFAKEGMDSRATELDATLRAHGIRTYYDDGGSIGRRYARMDEVGTPYCVTIDHESLKDGRVTIRERDSQKQVRVPIEGLAQLLQDLAHGRRPWSALA